MANQPVNARTTLPGPIASINGETDGEIFIPANEFMFDVGTWTSTRIAAGDFAMVKSAGANTSHPAINLTVYFLKKIGSDPNFGVYNVNGISPSTAFAGDFIAHALRGFQVTAIDVVYKIATANLTTHSAQINRVTYANNVANSVAPVGGSLSGTLATAIQANPYVTTLTPATPFVLGNNTTDVAEWFELLVTDPGTAVYTFYGIFVRGNYNFL